MEKELTLTKKQIARNDEIDNTVYQTLLVLLEKTEDELPWDMSLIGEVTEAIANICKEMGYHLRWPAILTNEDGTQQYVE